MPPACCAAPKRGRAETFTTWVVKPGAEDAVCTVANTWVGSVRMVDLPVPVEVRGTGTVVAEVTVLPEPTSTDVALITNAKVALVAVPARGTSEVNVAAGVSWATVLAGQAKVVEI